jgi:5'-nucleotidase (lipoprotein e(P4) family)
MRTIVRSKFCLIAVCLALGWLSAQMFPVSQSGAQRPVAPTTAEQPPKHANAPVFPMQARLGANMYLQTSGEYRACCLTIFRSAGDRLAAIVAELSKDGKTPAVVLDLDETVFDNSAFQTFLYQNNLEYTDELWSVYEREHPRDVTLIPGAREFLDKARSLGVTPVYLSNRMQINQAGSLATLEHLGIKITDPAKELFLKVSPKESNKTARRAQIAELYNVVMYVGDNLRDFSETEFAAKKPPEGVGADWYVEETRRRKIEADMAAEHWGRDWFVLPNPVYGEWDKLIGPDPLSLMHPTTMKAPAAKSLETKTSELVPAK